MKTQQRIRTLFTFCRFICIVLFIVSIIAFFGFIASSVLFYYMSFEYLCIIESSWDVDCLSSCSACAGWPMICIGIAILSKYSSAFFARTLKTGSPFTYASAKLLRRLSLLCIYLPPVFTLCGSFLQQYLAKSFGVHVQEDLSIRACTGSILLLSVAFFFSFSIFSLLCQLGAEQAEMLAPADTASGVSSVQDPCDVPLDFPDTIF